MGAGSSSSIAGAGCGTPKAFVYKSAMASARKKPMTNSDRYLELAFNPLSHSIRSVHGKAGMTAESREHAPAMLIKSCSKRTHWWPLGVGWDMVGIELRHGEACGVGGDEVVKRRFARTARAGR